MILLDKWTDKTIEVADKQATILLTNPKRWELSEKKPLPEIVNVKSETKEQDPQKTRGRRKSNN